VMNCGNLYFDVTPKITVRGRFGKEEYVAVGQN